RFATAGAGRRRRPGWRRSSGSWFLPSDHTRCRFYILQIDHINAASFTLRIMMPKSFDLNLLTVLDALIAERNVTRASQQLSRSPPAVSNALRRLRETFNDTLLVRGPNGMQLPPRAEALREPLRETVRVIDERILQEASFDPSLATGVYRISMP